MKPALAAHESIKKIALHYPGYSGAVLAVDNKGNYGTCSRELPLVW